MLHGHIPQVEGSLYDSRFEHDGCGIGFIARISGEASHAIVDLALTALGNLAHRGAVAADGKTGDGAGVLTQLPRRLLLRELRTRGINAEAQDLALGMFFLPRDKAHADSCSNIIEQELLSAGIEVLCWRTVPTNDEALGQYALETKPRMRQIILSRPASMDATAYERTLYLCRKNIERWARKHNYELYIPSLSSKSVIYKGLLVGPRLREFYTDLNDSEFESAIALYHQRYATNTFPSWSLAQPFRMLSHNGEINTLQGNVAWMKAREPTLAFPSPKAGEPDLPPEAIIPVIDDRGSDSAKLDNALELLTVGGRDIRHALAFLAPEAWEHVPDMSDDVRAFYQYHSCLMEPWDGPAALTFSDGVVVGSTLDRNGLRPARWLLTDDGLVVSGSEVGAVPIPDERIVRKGRLGPGQMIAVDTRTQRFMLNDEIKAELSANKPYREWIATHNNSLKAYPVPLLLDPVVPDERLQTMQHAFGYTSEELAVIMRPMLRDGQEPVGSMGDDTPLTALSQVDYGRSIFNCFKQRFAEVTNPPIDPLREELVMSLGISLGRRHNILKETPDHAHLLRVHSPILNDEQMATLRSVEDPDIWLVTVPALIELPKHHTDLSVPGTQATLLREAIDKLCSNAEQAARDGASVIVISDRDADETHIPIPSLLAMGAVHHHLIRTGWRSRMSLITESGDPRDVHHVAALLGFGGEAIYPYLALASVRNLALEREEAQNQSEGGMDQLEQIELLRKAEENFIHALEKGILKVMSKMGISTLDSYSGAQIFEAIGVDQDVIDQCFVGVPTRLGGVGFAHIAAQIIGWHSNAFPGISGELSHPGIYKFKKSGEYHAFNPQVVHALQRSTVKNPHALNGDSHETLHGYEHYKVYSDLVHSRPPSEVRDMLTFVPAAQPVPLDEVEPIESIVKRFSTAAMSHGSTSIEAHETLSIAMNRLGGMSNSGEGGEDPARYSDDRNSSIKQVASGRFGVTPAYLANATELQIKMAQGSKPGEGGQLPGHKVSAEIARIRYTVPGVSLISPPPHHDIYSIEDLAQLIYDLKQANDRARISVKLVSTVGVGTIAAGVAKGYADTILISGHSGGTGASPLSSIKNAAIPWELGLAETQQTLVLNGLRGRIRLRADGGLKTGHDVMMAALLGADEYSFGTAALVAEGCLMARACHSNTCPVGIATQRPDLRAKFPGKPEMVMAFFRYVAQEVRELLAMLGARSLDEVIGCTNLLTRRSGLEGVAARIDMSAILIAPERLNRDSARFALRHDATQRNEPPIHVPTLNEQLLRDAQPALAGRGPIRLSYKITNSERTFGTRLAGAIGKQYGNPGLPDGTISIELTGSAGQSFGAFTAPGMRLALAGEANDYVGKGMAGGTISVQPSKNARFAWNENVIAGNTILYGATGGELYLAGRAGERFAVRNSGAQAVVEGIGDHGCEYMTGGVVVVLGPVGYNFGAGMTGGIAYVYDPEAELGPYINPTLVRIDPLSETDEQRLLYMLNQHVAQTGSPHAEKILANWNEYRAAFRRVMPKEAVARLEAETEGTPKVEAHVHGGAKVAA